MSDSGRTTRAAQTTIERRPTWSAPTALSATRRLLPHSQPWNMLASPRSMSRPWLETGCVSVASVVEGASATAGAIRRSRPSAANRPSSFATSTSRPLNARTRSIVIAILVMAFPPLIPAPSYNAFGGARPSPTSASIVRTVDSDSGDRLLHEGVVGEDERGHRLNHRDGAWEHARIMAPAALDGRVLMRHTHRSLLAHDGGRGLEGDAEVD